MRIALYQPDIPQNTGTILRLCACLGIEAHVIQPAGFPTSDRAFRRAGMDYLDAVALVRHTSWRAFEAWRREQGHRLVLLTTGATLSYLDYRYGAEDVLLFGRESAGVPAEVHEAADARLLIPMRPGLRSLNVAVAVAMAAGEALRQIGTVKPQRISNRYASITPARPLSTAKVFNVETPAVGSCASETTRICTCMRPRSSSTLA
jgi:tRNA (cytidine/uridine-2'-O-)-methyltransferase